METNISVKFTYEEYMLISKYADAIGAENLENAIMNAVSLALAALDIRMPLSE